MSDDEKKLNLTQVENATTEYHSPEDSANFWKAVRNPLGGKDLSNLTPEEFVEELTKDRDRK